MLGAVMAASGLSNSLIRPGDVITVPDDAFNGTFAEKDQSALGQRALNQDNARLAALPASAGSGSSIPASSALGAVAAGAVPVMQGAGWSGEYGSMLRAMTPSEADLWTPPLGAPTIGPTPGLLSELGAIASSSLALGDKLDVAWDSVAFRFRNSNTAQASVQIAGGVLETGAGVATSETGVGTLLIVDGVDNTITGTRRLFSGGYQERLRYSAFETLTGSAEAARFLDEGVGLVAGVAAGASAFNSAAARAAEVSAASNAANAPRLAAQLTREEATAVFTTSGELHPEVLAGAREIIPGIDLSESVQARLTSNGSSIDQWSKFSTDSFKSPSGSFQVHFYGNTVTGEVNYLLDYKAVFNHQGAWK